VSLIRTLASFLPHPTVLRPDPAFGDPDGARLRQAMQAADWPTVRAILSAATDPDDHAFFVDLASRVQGCEAWLPDVVRDELDSTLPLLLYGARMINWGWDARTGARARYVSREQFVLFYERLRVAEDSLRSVVRREPTNTTAWYQFITSARGLELGLEESRLRLEQVLARHPGHLRAHQMFLQNVCRKWAGSHEEMHAFARRSLLNAPAGSALGHLVAAAHIEHWLDIGGASAKRYMCSAEVRASLRDAADRSVRHGAYRDQRGWPYVRNVFALAFCLAGDQDAAAEQFHYIGRLVTELPWGYIDADPVAAFRRRRAVALASSRLRRRRASDHNASRE
jgi:hypothetical protein